MIAYLTVFNYALLTALWCAILVLYLRYRRAARAEDAVVGVLAGVLALDAFKSVVENLYFGVLWTGQYHLAFESLTPWLSDPAMLLTPKLLNLAVAISILSIVIRVWIPADARERRERRVAESTLRGELVASLDEVRKKEERWQLALAATQDGIWDLDVATGELWVSPRFEEQLLHPRGALSAGFGVAELEALAHPEERDTIHRYLAELREGRSASIAGEVRLRARDGSHRRILLRAVALCGEGAEVVRIVGANSDVTEQRAAEAAMTARERTESLGLLAGGIAHDFNSLLTVLRGNAALVREAGVRRDAGESALDDLDLAISKATELTTRLLAYSGRGRFVVGPLDVTKLTGEIARLMRVSISDRIGIDAALATDLPAVDVDAAQIQQLVINLLGNAVDAIGEREGRVAVRTRIETTKESLEPIASGEASLPPGRYVVLEVEDTGIGMDEATRARVFEPFFSMKAQGRGLGMSAMLGILRAHGAGMRLRTAPGAGTTFTIYFPPSTASVPAVVVPTPRASEAPAAMVMRPRALLADDEAMLRRLFTLLLGEAGYDVDTANDGAAARAKLDEPGSDYALVVLDITMPGRNGREVLADLRSSGSLVPAILTSGYTQGEVPLDPHTVFLQKPFSVAQLREILGGFAR